MVRQHHHRASNPKTHSKTGYGCIIADTGRKDKNMDLYEMNETMKLLGKQNYGRDIYDNGAKQKAYTDMMDAIRACGRTYYGDVAMDAFTLGYIYGKRKERSKRKTRI